MAETSNAEATVEQSSDPNGDTTTVFDTHEVQEMDSATLTATAAMRSAWQAGRLDVDQIAQSDDQAMLAINEPHNNGRQFAADSIQWDQDGDSLFVPENQEFAVSNLNDLETSDFLDQALDQDTQSCEHSEGIVNDDDDHDDHDEEEDTQVDFNTKAESNNHAGLRETKRKRGRPKESGKKSSKSTAKPPTELSNINLDSIVGTSVFQDVNATAHLPVMPDIRGGRRKEALQALGRDAAAEGLDGSDTKILEAALKAFDGKQRIKAVDGGFEVLGMKAKLHAYQVVGVGFMRKLEKSCGPGDAHGGILADTMGLGKTVMTLTNIVNGQPTARRERKPTLIVASPALLQQWMDEIQKHVEVGKSTTWGLHHIVFFKDIAAMRSDCLLKHLQQQDIVLATYHAVLRSFPALKPPVSCTTLEQKGRWMKKHFEENCGPLHRFRWHRVVLDEAHAIKNLNSRTSLACRQLRAQHHWAITGTPAHNSIKEFFPYLKFIRDPLISSRAQFEQAFCNVDDPEAGAMLSKLLSRVMLRRTHASTMFGRRLIELPTLLPINEVDLDFSSFEQKIYNIVHQKFRERAVACKQSNKTNKHRHIYAMLLRLRQLTGHVLMLQGPLQDLLDLHDIAKLESLCKQYSEEQTSEEAVLLQKQFSLMLEQAKTIQVNRGVRNLSQSQAPDIEMSQITEEDYDGLGVHGTDSFRPEFLLDVLNSNESMKDIVARTKCVYCHNKPLDPQVTSCDHVYCRRCIERVQRKAATFGRDHAVCRACSSAFTSVRPCTQVSAQEDGLSDSDTSAVEGNRRRKRHTKKNQELDWTRMDGPVPPSTKTKAMVSQVTDWIAEDPSIKIIIYSQFRSMLNLLARICRSEGWTYVKYQGDMTTEARTAAISKFSNPSDNVRILLASLKCGGQGLNLTAAARVLLMVSVAIQVIPWAILIGDHRIRGGMTV